MMKTKIPALALAMLMTVATPMMAYADTTNTAAATATTAATTSAAISLTLDEAFAALKDSPQMALIEMQYTADKAAVRGYSETVNRMDDAAEALKGVPRSLWGELDLSGEKTLEAARDFGNAVAEPNKTARLNALNTSMTETYYGVKNVETLTKIAKENLDITQKTYDQTALKYKLGTVSKLDMLNAETDLAKAKDSYQKAADGLSQAKMGFNLYMGYDLLRPVTLTSEVKEVALPTITLEEALKQAEANRLSIKSAEYQLKAAKLSASNYTAYPRNSSTYLKGAAAVLGAETAAKLALPQVQMDVRSKYMDMKEKYAAVQTGKLSVANSKEALRLCQLQYEKGLCTLTTVQKAQLGYIAAENEQAQALLDYNLSVQAFTYSYGVGTEAASI